MSSGPGTRPRSQPLPRGKSPMRVILPAVGVPLALLMAYNYMTRDNPFKTPGVSNIEKAMVAGGSTRNNIPGYGGTPRGNQNDATLAGNPNPQTGGKERSQQLNRDGEHAYGEEQRPVQPTVVGRKWNEFKYGNKDGR